MRVVISGWIAVFLAWAPMRADAAFWIGLVSDDTTHRLLRFDRFSTQQIPLTSVLQGDATLLGDPLHGAYEPTEDVFYVPGFNRRTVLAFSASASGNTAPVRVLLTNMQTYASVPVADHDELAVYGSSFGFATYPLRADGQVAPLRVVTWGGPTELTWSMDPVHITASDEIAGINDDAGPEARSKIVFHARTAQSNATPTRVFRDPRIDGAVSMAWDDETGLLHVLSLVPGSPTYEGVIDVFAVTPGDITPVRRIAGPTTGLVGLHHASAKIAVDRWDGRLVVAIGPSIATMGLTVKSFDLDAQGDVPPRQNLEIALAPFEYSGALFSVPTTSLFRGGFDP